ncbi:MAG: DUF3109 family protein [Prevotellaceae bacterium]|jgi:hypothetical protein|nr:DUF3109 family protein [Prevotellaceae bacterium]
MIQIDDKVISLDLFEEHFICDLPKCLGACCVYGDSGALLENEEKELIEQHFDKIKPYLTPDGLSVIERCGVAMLDFDNELVTPLIGKNYECVYSCFSGDGICMCAIEKAYRNGDIPFNKPVSCHLYPIRIKTFNNITVLNYDRWHICNPAKILGNRKQMPVFMFLKEPVIRKFGKDFYEAMIIANRKLKSNNEQ